MGILIILAIGVVCYFYNFSYSKIDIPKKVNNVETSNIIDIAKRYVLTKPQIYIENSEVVNWSDKKFDGTNLDAEWIVSHTPSVEFNPSDKWPEPYSYYNNKYVITWFFIPGCEENPKSKNSPNWFDKEGRQCLGGYGLIVFIDPNLQPEKIILNAMK